MTYEVRRSGPQTWNIALNVEHREVIGEKNEPDKPIPTLNVCAFAVERMQRSARVSGKETLLANSNTGRTGTLLMAYTVSCTFYLIIE